VFKGSTSSSAKLTESGLLLSVSDGGEPGAAEEEVLYLSKLEATVLASNAGYMLM
jgi:hypothetical protein